MASTASKSKAGSSPAKTTKKTKGREARKQTAIAKAHEPNLNRFYDYDLPRITPGDFSFQVTLHRPLLAPLPLDKVIETVAWTDEASALTGSLTLYRPKPGEASSLPISRGDMVSLEVLWDKQTYKLWTMRCGAPQDEVDTGTVSVDLKDDLVLLEGDTQDWDFRKTKKRPKGYTATEITRAVAKAVGIPTGEIAGSTVQQSMVKRNASARDVITAAWKTEFDSTHQTIILRLRDGKLEVVNITRNPTIYVLGQQIQTALVAQKGGAKTPVTVLLGTAKIDKGKQAKKISFTMLDRRVVDALGFVRESKSYGTVQSHAELRNDVKRDYAKAIRLPDTITISTPGLPFINRGDGAQIRMPGEGYKGQNSFVWCISADHSASDGQYTTTFQFGFSDPVINEINAEAKAAAARAAKSSKRGISPSSSPASGSGERWLVTASAEDDPPGAQGACRVIQSDGYSELSTVPMGTASDFSALGHIPCLTQMKITNPANGKTVVATKQDVGAGSSFLPVMGIYPGTRAALGLDDSGEYHVLIERADGGALSPVRGTKQ